MNEMRMLRWMCGVTKKDNIRNEHVRASVKVTPVTKKITGKSNTDVLDRTKCKGSFTIVNIFSIVQRVLFLRPPSPLPKLVH